MTQEQIPKKIEIREGEAYVRYEGVTYRVKLEYFCLEATEKDKHIQFKGTVQK